MLAANVSEQNLTLWRYRQPLQLSDDQLQLPKVFRNAAVIYME